MTTLKNIKKQNRTENTWSRIFQSVLVLVVLCIASDIFGQTNEVQFEVYTNSANKASQYLLGDDVAMRDCASIYCEKLATINIGTHVRLLAKSNTAQTINGITSRFYKIKMGPQVGWIWGGLISQKTMVSQINPEIKFVFGEAGINYKGYKRFQIRATRNGTEIDKIFVTSESLSHELVGLLTKKENTYNLDVISLCNDESESVNSKNCNTFVVFKDNKLIKTNGLADLEKMSTENTNYAFSCEIDNNQ